MVLRVNWDMSLVRGAAGSAMTVCIKFEVRQDHDVRHLGSFDGQIKMTLSKH